MQRRWLLSGFLRLLGLILVFYAPTRDAWAHERAVRAEHAVTLDLCPTYEQRHEFFGNDCERARLSVAEASALRRWPSLAWHCIQSDWAALAAIAFILLPSFYWFLGEVWRRVLICRDTYRRRWTPTIVAPRKPDIETFVRHLSVS